MTPATYDTWTISMQREVRRGMTVEVDYNGSRGTRLQANLLNLNQVPLEKVNDLINRFGATQALAILNSAVGSATANAAGITAPYANFTNPAFQTTRSVAQSLRPYPQYGTINTTNSGGDKTGESMYHAGVLKLTQRLSAGFLFQGSYTYSRLMTNADVFSGSTGSMDTAQPELEYSHRSARSAAQIKLNTVFELPWGQGRRWLNERCRRAMFSVDGVLRQSRATAAVYRSGDDQRCAVADFQRLEPAECDRSRIGAAPIAGDDFNPRVDRYLNRAAFSAPVAQLGNAPRVNGDVRRPWNMTENMSLAKTVSMPIKFGSTFASKRSTCSIGSSGASRSRTSTTPTSV